MLLEGLFLPVTTPFYLDGRLNLRKLGHNVDRYCKTPVSGLVVLSEHGDPTLLDDVETREALRSAMQAAAAEKVMIAGVSRDSVPSTVELSAYAGTLGYDAVAVGLPTLFRGERDGRGMEVLTYFQTVADQSPLPIILVSSAARYLPIELLAALAGHPNVLGAVEGDASRIAAIKEATSFVKREVTVTHVFAAATGRMLAEKDTSAGATFISADMLNDGATALAVAPPKPGLRIRMKTIGFQVLQGSAGDMLQGLQAGATGAMPAFGAAAPQAVYEVWAAWKDDDQALALEKQLRVQPAAQHMEMELGSAGIRYGCDLNGYFGGRPRLPLLPVTGEQKLEIESWMSALRN